ncbi:ABC transporter permease [Candidatus Bipolaricaulota bacterium]|nr:ABC transporter permease [Candidatus Bipolaricaulota bacterium]
MLIYSGKRLLQAFVSIFIASLLIFLVAEGLPGDVAQMVLGQYATEDSLAALREQLGLNRPLHVRYFDWLTGVLRGDFGTSLSRSGLEVGPLLLRRARNSVVLAAGALIFVVPVSLVLGVAAGLNQDSWLDRSISVTTLGLISFPSFITGLILILVFSVYLDLLPASGAIEWGEGLWSQLPGLILPVLALSGVMTGYIVRHTRASVVKVMKSDYTRSAILKGMNSKRVVLNHVLRNALLPTVTVIAINLGWLLGGAVVVEATFSYPGVGRLILTAIKQRDVPIMEAGLLFVVGSYIFINLFTDLLYSFLNPRLRYGGEE